MLSLIRRPPERSAAPILDDDQRVVVEHPGGPLLVLAGPGTGKTTTLVEAVVARVASDVRPEQVLTLAFSRRAAAELRDRIAARLGPAVITPPAMTFHSFCHSLIRRFGDADAYGVMPRLLTAPEQEFRVREILEGSRSTGRAQWPASLREAFPTRAFAGEVRAVLAKSRQLGLDPEDLVAAGRAAARPEWEAVGRFFDEYLDVLDAERVLDYAELVHRSRILLADPAHLDALRRDLTWIFVDEYHDTDPAQVALLQSIAGQGGNIVAVGDPDQSIYGFRGTDARGILDFPERFRTRDGIPAPVVALGQQHRQGRRIQSATRGVARRLGLARPLPPDVTARLREPRVRSGGPGRVEVFTCSSPGAEAEHVAELIREAHLRDGLAWSDMAVLVRSGGRAIPVLSRALAAAGVPVEVAGDEIPLAAEPAVRPLLLALELVSRDSPPTSEEAHVLLTSPLGGLDGMAIRRLGRALRDAERTELAGTALPSPSAELVAAALHDPGRLDELAAASQPGEIGRAQALADLLGRCRRAVRAGETAEEILWRLWTETGWAPRLRALAAQSGDVGRRSDKDLDAVCALFDLARRSEAVSGRRGVSGFLAEVEGQQIPADTWREAGVRGHGVRLLTAHRAKGLEWELVAVVGVQEGVWPDIRRRGGLLEADRLSAAGVTPPEPSANRVAEERRLFYVACTRARSRLVVTAVDGTDGEGDQPSRFLGELDAPLQSRSGRPRRPLSLTALVAELRRTSVDPEVSSGLREQACLRLARLADLTDPAGRPQVPAARPATWWGIRPLSAATEPVTPPGAPVQLSGSQLAALIACPRQWFLARKAGAATPRSSAASFGSVIHALAEHGAAGADATTLAGHLEAIWDQLAFDAHWLSAVERVEAEAALERFVAWQAARPAQELLGTEVGFSCELDVGRERLRLTGSADRVERDPDGRIRIVDFKTGRSVPTSADVAVHEQLGVYQLAVAAGAFDEVAGPGARPAGADLVYLRLADSATDPTGLPKVFHQASLDDVAFPPGVTGGEHPTWIHDRVAEAAATVRAERFEARVGPGCRYCPFQDSCPTQTAGRRGAG